MGDRFCVACGATTSLAALPDGLCTRCRRRHASDAALPAAPRLDLVALLRERTDWTQGEIASHLGITQPEVSKILSGKRRPSQSVLQRMAAILGVDPLEAGAAGSKTPYLSADDLLRI